MDLLSAYLLAKRNEEAMDWVDRALREMPRNNEGISVKIVLCVQLARRDEGSDWVSRLLDLQPGLTVADLKAYAVKFLASQVLEIYIENLHKAGLPDG